MKPSKVFYLLGILLITISLSISCEKSNDDNPGDPVPINLTDKQVALVKSGNEFAFDIFRKTLENEAPEKNIMISPLSISYALSMTVNGADGPTRDSILKALRVSNISIEELNRSYKDLTAALLSVDKRVAMKIANSVWTEQNFSVKKAFIDVLTDYYMAESKPFNINDANTPSIINQWIKDNTNGLIKDMIDQLDPATVMLLINAIYFKGMWKYEFDKAETTQRPFSVSGGSQLEVPSMSQAETHKVYQGEGFTMVELPYGQGNFVMDVILPDTQSGTSFFTNVNESDFNEWTKSLSPRKVNLYMPRFKYKYKKTLNEILADMGMTIAFTDIADFTNIAEAPLHIDSVLHQTFIETNEEGTEAAAATAVIVVLTTNELDTTLLIDINRPFIYIIREITTNTIIFMGRVSNPLSE